MRPDASPVPKPRRLAVTLLLVGILASLVIAGARASARPSDPPPPAGSLPTRKGACDDFQTATLSSMSVGDQGDGHVFVNGVAWHTSAKASVRYSLSCRPKGLYIYGFVEDPADDERGARLWIEMRDPGESDTYKQRSWNAGGDSGPRTRIKLVEQRRRHRNAIATVCVEAGNDNPWDGFTQPDEIDCVELTKDGPRRVDRNHEPFTSSP